ncbi:replication factor-A protein [Xylaria bambusicola]|uniref:replication factor-A protein n=1 Tax=Xylaria bambusicola TaxID=326684 RepID=UPI0020086049|nr:replication factor-A protein [Xylaria bambusicola]KAI0521847.1 replication factor-A protein [Xylaria bambusicola]
MSVAGAQQAITQGALDAIFNEPGTADQRFPVPVLQCLQIKPLAAQQAPGGPTTQERYRVVLSDIRNYVQCMLATQANHVIHDNQLARGCIVRVKSYQANEVKGKNILIILDLEVATELGTHDRIGEPAPFEAKSTDTSTAIGGTGFYGAKTESPAPVIKAEPMSSRMGPAGGGMQSTGSKAHGNIVIYPIEAITPYAHKWTIKARVTSKSDIKTWHKASGEGKLFSVNLLDESGEIRATGFNEQCDAFYELLQEGQVYYISTCKVNLAKKQFSNLPNDYELAFERETMIEKAEDQSSVPQVRFNFVPISELQSVEKDVTVDVVGVLKDVGEVSQIVSKTTQKPYDKRELTLVDDSRFSVRLTLWGKTATTFSAQPESVVAFKGVKVSDFGGRSLSLLASGTMALDPDIEEAHRLKGWYDSEGRADNFSTHNSMASMGAATGRKDQTKVISQVKDEGLGMENPDYFTLKATIVYIKQENFAYPACSEEGCNKKVVDQGDGTWRCEKCDIAHARPRYRYIMSVNVNDHTGQLWLSCFDDVGRIIMGMTADELMEVKENDEDRAPAIFEAANCSKFTFQCRAKMDTYGENPRVRYQVMSATPIDYKTEALKLADMIKQFGISS